MQTHVAILHHDYPSPVRDQVDEKLQHLARFHERTVSIKALLERQKDDHRVEIVANVGQGAVLVADARHTTFGLALDEALARMTGLLKRYNEKQNLGRRRANRHG